jgi:hypothetical protein
MQQAAAGADVAARTPTRRDPLFSTQRNAHVYSLGGGGGVLADWRVCPRASALLATVQGAEGVAHLARAAQSERAHTRYVS